MQSFIIITRSYAFSYNLAQRCVNFPAQLPVTSSPSKVHLCETYVPYRAATSIMTSFSVDIYACMRWKLVELQLETEIDK